MKRVRAFMAAVAVTAATGTAMSPDVAAAKASSALTAEFNLKGLAGGTLHAADLHGQKTVLQFFASWCEGCGHVMGQVGHLTEGSAARFVPVSVDETMAEAKGYFKHQKDDVQAYQKRAYLDTDTRLASALDVKSLPATVVLDESGRVVAAISGHPTKRQLTKLKSLIAK